MKANSSRIVRKANKYLILNMIRQCGKVTLDMVQTQTRLSYPTVNKIVNELLESEVLMKDGVANSNGGKPATLISLNNKKYFAMGIDVEIPVIRFAISDLNGNIINGFETEMSGILNKDSVINEILNGIKKCSKDSGLEVKQVIGIGIGLPGTVDLTNNFSVAIERVQDWINVDLVGIIREKFKIPVYIRNDVHLMALVENAFMRDEQNDFALIAIRQGTGMAIVLGGSVFEGTYGNAGFIGHTTIIADGEKCHCGKHGCLDVYSGKDAIEKAYKKRTKSTERLGLLDIIALSSQGDEIAIEILKNAGKYLGIAIANNIKILDIKTFIISGLLVAEQDVFFDTILSTVNSYLIFARPEEIKVKKSHFHNNEFMLGGCYLVIENFFAKPNLRLEVQKLQ